VAKIKHKQIVKELKHPDQFVDFWTHAWQRIVAVMAPRQKPAIAVGVALAVAVVGASIINYWEGSRHLEGARTLSRIQEIANADLLSDSADSKDEPVRKGDAPRFKTPLERQSAVVKEVDQFLSAGAPGALKAQALILKGAALLASARNDDALVAYQAALDGRLDPRLNFLAHEGQGYAYEAKGDLDKALLAFGKLEGDAAAFRGFYEDRALYHKARLTELKGDKAGAVGVYKQILVKVPETGLKDEISDRLASIEAK
jgi:tetratricopeptide (TPR) repeat protein